jgi:hypothetical protein
MTQAFVYVSVWLGLLLMASIPPFFAAIGIYVLAARLGWTSERPDLRAISLVFGVSFGAGLLWLAGLAIGEVRAERRRHEEERRWQRRFRRPGQEQHLPSGADNSSTILDDQG